MNTILPALMRRRSELLKKDEKGFTLVELLVVVLIIGVLAAVAIPLVMGSVDNAKQAAVKSAATQAKSIYASELFDNPDSPAEAAKTATEEMSENGIKVTTEPATIGADTKPDAVEFTATDGDWKWTTGSDKDPERVTK